LILRSFRPAAEFSAIAKNYQDGRNNQFHINTFLAYSYYATSIRFESHMTNEALYVQVEGFEQVHPIANEDLERETEDKTSAVHFVRFELSPEMVVAAKQGVAIRAGIDHPAYREEVVIADLVRRSLVGDLH
jgi:hypothetical protein